MKTGAFGQPCVSGHQVEIHDRGGNRRINPLVDVTRVKWGRQLDGQPIFEVLIAGRQACVDQLKVLLAIDPRRHEMVIFRGTTRVAEGPILQVKWLNNGVVVIARDITEYLKGTVLSKPWPNKENGGPELMTDRIEQIIEWELSQPYAMRIGTGGAATVVTVNRWENIATPANVLPHVEVRPSATLKTLSDTLGFEMTVLEHLDNLADGYLNYTTVGRKLLIWDSHQSIGETKKLTDADFYGAIEVIDDGTDYSDIVHVSANRDEDAGTQDSGVTQGVGHDGGEDSYFGVWDYISTTTTEEGSEEPTEDELNSQAQRIERIRSNRPLYMSIPASAGLRLSDDLTIQQLIPGVVMPVSATFNLKQVTQRQMLTYMQVEETPGRETVQVTLAPAGPLEVI